GALVSVQLPAVPPRPDLAEALPSQPRALPVRNRAGPRAGPGRRAARNRQDTGRRPRRTAGATAAGGLAVQGRAPRPAGPKAVRGVPVGLSGPWRRPPSNRVLECEPPADAVE